MFRDDDGQHYLYYGGWRHCNIVRLTPDLLGLAPFPDGVVFKDITPANYVEGPFVFKRQGKYYLMWSEGGWQGPNYSVAYAIGDSPAGPFSRVGKVLQQDPGVATGAGHHSVIPVPGSDTLVHRLPPPPARHEGRQPPGSLHRRDALQPGRHDPPRADHVRRREGEAAAPGPVGPEQASEPADCPGSRDAQNRNPNPAPNVSG